MASSAAPAPPSKAERAKCYTARDAYFECLDKTIDDTSACAKLKSSVDELCPAKWVSIIASLKNSMILK